MLNVIPVGTTKKTAIEYTQKEMRKELKCFSTKKINQTQMRIMQKMDKKAVRHIESKWENHRIKSLLISNYFER